MFERYSFTFNENYEDLGDFGTFYYEHYIAHGRMPLDQALALGFKMVTLAATKRKTMIRFPDMKFAVELGAIRGGIPNDLQRYYRVALEYGNYDFADKIIQLNSDKCQFNLDNKLIKACLIGDFVAAQKLLDDERIDKQKDEQLVLNTGYNISQFLLKRRDMLNFYIANFGLPDDEYVIRTIGIAEMMYVGRQEREFIFELVHRGLNPNLLVNSCEKIDIWIRFSRKSSSSVSK